MKIAITGARTTIAQAFMALVPDAEIVEVGRADQIPADADAYLFAQGYLVGTHILSLLNSHLRADRTWADNFGTIAARCDLLAACNPKARICIIGSWSGMKGSYDMAYAGSKAAMHLYIETKKLKCPGQQIVGIAPHIIADSGMTDRRKDHDDVIARGKQRRRGEWIAPEDVAKLAHFLLCVDSGNICNVIIPMHGGIE